MKIFEMVQQFSGELFKYLKEGAPNVTVKEYENRLKTCEACPHLTETFKCNKCGCNMTAKAKWATSKCPLDKWEEIKKK